MIRSQVYLTPQERKFLMMFSSETGQSQSEIIRAAIDQFIANWSMKKKDTMDVFGASKGLWKNRVDLPDFSELRKEFDRGFNELENK